MWQPSTLKNNNDDIRVISYAQQKYLYFCEGGDLPVREREREVCSAKGKTGEQKQLAGKNPESIL